MGLPGDTVQAKNGVLYINGKEYPEDYIAETYHTDTDLFYVPKKDDVVTVENNACYIRNYYVGELSFIKQYCVVKDEQYVVEEDCYFCLGDNVNNSYDSFDWQDHYVRFSKIKAKAFLMITPKIKIFK